MTYLATGPFSVYQRSVGYNDEHLYVSINSELDALLSRWSDGDQIDFARAWANWNTELEAPERALSTHSSISEAFAVAKAEHLRLATEMTFIGLGFVSFGCEPEAFPFDATAAYDYDEDRDMQRLRTWCADNVCEIPSLDPSDPQVLAKCGAIAKRSLEGEMWLDCIEDGPEGASPFAADLVAEQLEQTGRAALRGDLFTALVCDLTFVGPSVAAPRQSVHPPQTAPAKPGFFRRIFKG